MFISEALAQTAGAETGSPIFGSILMWGLIIFIFYFLLIRPQNQRMKKHRAMVETAKRGDTVVTGGGIVGKITRVKDDEVQIEIADNVRVNVLRSTLSDVRAKGTLKEGK
jgi:preprotein translocase subunit YajC